MQLVNNTQIALALVLLILYYLSIVPDIINVLFIWHWLEMDSEAKSLLAIMRTQSLPEGAIVEFYSRLKADIKHKSVPQSAVEPLFELIRLALDSPNYLDAGLSMLTHLIKRLQQQQQQSVIDLQAPRLVPIIIQLLGSARDRHRSRARQALTELYTATNNIPNMVIDLLTDVTFRSNDPRAMQEAIQWISMMHQDKGFKPPSGIDLRLIDCLKSPDRYLSKAAKACLVQVYQNAYTSRKDMLKNHLQNTGVDSTVAEDILFQINSLPEEKSQRSKLIYPSPHQPSSRWPSSSFNGSVSDSRNPSRQIPPRTISRSVSRSTEMSTNTVSHKPSGRTNTTTSHSSIDPPSFSQTRPTSRSVSQSTETSTNTVSHKPSESTNTTISHNIIEPLPFVPVKSKAEAEADKLNPMYVDSARDVDNIFRDMLPYFEGAESEQNWKHREQSALKIRKLTKGNAYDDYPTSYLAGIKLLLNGLIGVAESLRTTQCSLGCHCIEDLARRTGSSLDPFVEILLQSLVKLCGQTKKITAANGDSSVTCIISHASFNARIAQHIYGATQDKNVSPRLFACGWLMTVLTRHGHHKSVFEHHGALESVNKSITAGLMDRDASVRSCMRPTYWAFARLWSVKSESILLSLDKKQQELLLKDAANPFPDTSSVAAVLGEKAAAVSQSTTAAPPRPSIKETMARNRANRNLPAARPSSAGPTTSPTREASTQVASKLAVGGTATRRPLNTSASGNLSSAPVRPNRTLRKPDIPRPATADPSSHRPKPDARSATPAARRPKTPVAPATVKKGILAVKKPASQPVSPSKTVQRRISWSDDLPGGSLVSGPSGDIDDDALEDDDGARPKSEGNHPSTQSLQGVVDALSSTSISSYALAKVDAGKEEDVWLTLSKSPQTSPQANEKRSRQQNATVLPRSPINNAADAAHKQTDDEVSTRISQSPLQTQILSPRKRPQLQVYEDSEVRPLNVSPAQSPPESQVLSDLPINAPPFGPNHILVAEEPNDSSYHAKWAALEASEKKLCTSPAIAYAVKQPVTARLLLASAIKQINGGVFELPVLRKVQYIIKDQNEIWSDVYLVEELLLTLLDAVEVSTNQTKQIQLVIAIRALLARFPQQCSTLYPRALVSITAARAGHSASQRIVSGLEATAETLVAECEPVDSMNQLLDLLDTENLDLHALVMGIYNLAGLLSRLFKVKIPLDHQTEQRIGDLIGRCFNDVHTDIRRATVELVVQFHPCVKPETRFWAYVPGSVTDHRSLVTYYLERNAAAQH